jgi:DNA-binding CsgD family transcriptional regulator
MAAARPCLAERCIWVAGACSVSVEGEPAFGVPLGELLFRGLPQLAGADRKHALVTGMELARVLQAIGALRRARDGEDFVLLATGVIDGILRILAADMICFDDVDAAKRSVTLVLWPIPMTAESRAAPHRERGASQPEFGAPKPELGQPQPELHEALSWTDTSGVGHALVMPLPASAGNCRRLVFLRRPGCAFSDEDRSAAILLQPHIADALRCQSRHAAARLLTDRQRELLCLVAAGHDNIAIARRLGLSPYTVRKHLENAFARLDVTSRTAAVAKVRPDATWLDPPAVA